MATSNSLFFVLLLLFTTTTLFLIVEGDNIHETCKAVEAASQNNPIAPPVNSTSCITLLRADPKSATADKPGLAAIAIRLSTVHATSSKAKIDVLNKKKVSAVLHGILDVCSNFYAQGISSLEDASKKIIIGGGAGKYKDVVELLNFSRDASYNCDIMFYEGGQINVVAKEGDELTSLVVIAQEILKSLG